MTTYKGYNVPNVEDYLPPQILLDDVGIGSDDADGIAQFYCDEIAIDLCTKDNCKKCLFGGQNKKQDKTFMTWHEARLKQKH